VIARLHALYSALWHEWPGPTATEYALMDLVSQRVEERLRGRSRCVFGLRFRRAFPATLILGPGAVRASHLMRCVPEAGISAHP
jgi:hypothetical protein